MTTSSKTSRLVRLQWRLRIRMAFRDIRTVTDLRRRLEAVGVEISSQQLNRVVNDFPDRLSTKLLAGLLTVLECRIEDLIGVDGTSEGQPDGETTPDAAPKTEPKPRKRPPSRPQVQSEPVDVILGPKVSPFPKRPGT